MMYPAIIARYIVEGNMSMGEPIDSELADAFADFLPRFKRWVEHLLPPGGPTAVRVRLLGMVHCEGPQKMSGLATALGITARRVTALADALEEEGVARAQALRRLGDTSLFVSGMFSESLSSSLVDVGYAIAMGSRAYDALGDVAERHGRGARSLWDELSEKFSQLVEVLNEVSDRTLSSSNAGLLRIYERWMRTGSARIATLLAEHGVPAVVCLPKGRFAQ